MLSDPTEAQTGSRFMCLHEEGPAGEPKRGRSKPLPCGKTESDEKGFPQGEDSLRRREMSAKPTEGGVERCLRSRLMRIKYIHLIHRKRSPFPSRGRHSPIGSLRSPLPPAGEACGKSKALCMAPSLGELSAEWPAEGGPRPAP